MLPVHVHEKFGVDHAHAVPPHVGTCGPLGYVPVAKVPGFPGGKTHGPVRVGSGPRSRANGVLCSLAVTGVGVFADGVVALLGCWVVG